jgi:SSS family solute:Na+ symporter
MAADSMTAARRTPLIAAVPKMFFPFLVILPGMIALAMGDNIIPAKLTAAGTPVISVILSAIMRINNSSISPGGNP